jgi:hypothetical protein
VLLESHVAMTDGVVVVIKNGGYSIAVADNDAWSSSTAIFGVGHPEARKNFHVFPGFRNPLPRLQILFQI